MLNSTLIPAKPLIKSLNFYPHLLNATVLLLTFHNIVRKSTTSSQRCSRPIIPITYLRILSTPPFVTYFGKLRDTYPGPSLTNLQNPTGVPNLRTRMRKPGTSGMCGYNKGGKGVANTSVILIISLQKKRNCIDKYQFVKYESLIFDQINQAADLGYKLFWKMLRRQGGSSFEACSAFVVDGRFTCC